MNPDEIRIAVAKACGWTKIYYRPLLGFDESLPSGWFGTKDATCVRQGQEVPDYLNNANAALELISLLVKDGYWVETQHGFLKQLGVFVIVKRGQKVIETAWASTLPPAVCQVFLRVRGKWKEDKQ